MTTELQYSDIACCYNCIHYKRRLKHCEKHPEKEVESTVNCSLFEVIKKPVPINFLKEKKEKKEKEDDNAVYTNSLITDDFILEEILINGVPKFVNYDVHTGERQIDDEVIVDETVYKPRNGDELKESIKAVHLPTGVEEYGSEIELDKEIETHLRTWLDLDDKDYKRMVWQIRFSWVYERFPTLNYSRALGDTGTGKSRFLSVVGHLHYTPMIVAGALTPAVIFRIINKWKGTLIIDEADQKSSEETDAFIKILNCGYEKGMPVSRCNRENNMQLEFYDIYCPKVISTRKSFTDKATEARCMTIVMRQTRRKDIKEVLTKAYHTEVERLRKKLLMYRLKNWHRINPEKAMDVDINFIEPRLRQVNRSFMALFMDDEEQLKIFKDYLKHYQRRILEERAESFDGEIVNALARLIADGKEYITASMIVDNLNSKQVHFIHEITARGVNKCLRGLGLEIRLSRAVNDLGSVGKFITLDHELLCVLFERYIVDEDLVKVLCDFGYVFGVGFCNQSCNCVTNVTDITESKQNILIDNFMNKTEIKNIPSVSLRNGYNGYIVTESFEKNTPKNKILGIMKSINLDIIPIEEVLKKWLEEKLPVESAEILINELINEGVLFEPKAGFLKVL